jgi:hypothetical protein
MFMEISDQELRALVRDAIARHGRAVGTPADSARPAAFARIDASHARFSLATGSAEDDGRCVIEPGVRCNHCGYCQSLGH